MPLEVGFVGRCVMGLVPCHALGGGGFLKGVVESATHPSAWDRNCVAADKGATGKRELRELEDNGGAGQECRTGTPCDCSHVPRENGPTSSRGVAAQASNTACGRCDEGGVDWGIVNWDGGYGKLTCGRHPRDCQPACARHLRLCQRCSSSAVIGHQQYSRMRSSEAH
jgi:hypothetical protein